MTPQFPAAFTSSPGMSATQLERREKSKIVSYANLNDGRNEDAGIPLDRDHIINSYLG